MEEIKVYDSFRLTSSPISFKISKMEEHYKKRKGKNDSPHRHNFFTVLVLNSGNGKHIIDFSEYELKSNQVYFVAPGQVHQLIENKSSKGFVILFSDEFLTNNHIDKKFLEDINLFHEFGDSPPLEPSINQFDELLELSKKMFLAQESNSKFYLQEIASYLQLLLIKCSSFCTITDFNTQQIDSGNNILKNFKNLVDSNYKKWHHISDYADKLFVTGDHLNRVIKSLTGKTSKEMIQSKITSEAKRMLHFTDLSSKEIAYELGFSEPGNFSTFFKKCTGISPTDFRNKSLA